MTRSRLPWGIYSAILLLTCFGAFAQTPRQNSAKPFADGIAATVNGKVITKSEVREAVAQQSFLAYRQIGDPKERAAKLKEIEREGLQALIDRELILAEHDKRAGQPRDYMIDSYEKRFIHDVYKGDRNAFLEDLRKNRITHKKFREERIKQFKVQRMQAAITAGLPPATPAEVETYYRSHIHDFQEEGEVKLRTITIPKYPEPEGFDAPIGDDIHVPATPATQRLLAQQVLGKLRKGASFAEMAKVYSKDSVAKQGGDRGIVDRKTLNPFLAEAAFDLKNGEISKLIEDERNFYILWAESRHYGRTAPLDEARDQVEQRVTAEKKRKLVDNWLTTLRSRASIRKY